MTQSENQSPRWIAGIEPSSDLLALSMTSIYEMECREQPRCLAALFGAYQADPDIEAQLGNLQRKSFSAAPILLIGMGASYCSCVAGASWLQSGARSAFAVDAGEWLHYSSTKNQAALSLIVTTSGESAELVELCRNPAIGSVALLCNNSKSTCWSLVKDKLPILAGPEYGNATKTYTNATAACIILADQILGRAWSDDASRLLHSYSTTLDRVFAQRNEMEDFCRGAANIEIIGRGPAYGSAIMGALCIREMTGQRAAPHSGGGFRHGPILDVDQSHVAIIFALGRTAALGVSLAHDCVARGGRVILVEADERKPSERLLPIHLDPVPEPWESLTSILVPQALTLAIAERHGARLSPRFQYGEMKE